MSEKGAIGFFNSVMSWGGGEKWHYEAATYFAAKGYSVYFFTAENSVLHKKLSDHKNIHIELVRITGTSFLNPVKVSRLKRVLQRAKLDALIINLPNDLKLASFAGKLAGVKKIIYRRGSAIPIRNSLMNRFVFRNWVTDVLANSQATKRTILQHNARLFPEGRIKVIYNPIDTEEFTLREYEPARQSGDHEFIIGNLGRLEHEKNQRFLIRLSERLQEEKLEHKVVIGGTGRLERELKEEAKKRRVRDNIHFLGFVRNVKNVLMNCDVFVLPSLWEGFGYVLAEAALCKKPIIAFNLSSIPEIVLDKKSGFLINNNVEECVEKIRILKEQKELRDKMGECGYKYVTQRFDSDKIMAEVEDFVLA